MLKSKNRYIYHIFVSPGDAPGAITLNVVWMERESDAYKLSRCMCPSKYNRFWDTARYLWKKIGISSYPLAFDATVRGVPVAISAPLCYGKTRMVSLPDGEKISNISVRFGATHERDGQRQMDGHRVTAIAALCIASHGKKIAVFTYRSPHFCFPWRRPCDYHAICCMNGNTIQCLPNPSQHVPIYIQ